MPIKLIKNQRIVKNFNFLFSLSLELHPHKIYTLNKTNNIQCFYSSVTYKFKFISIVTIQHFPKQHRQNKTLTLFMNLYIIEYMYTDSATLNHNFNKC